MESARDLYEISIHVNGKRVDSPYISGIWYCNESYRGCTASNFRGINGDGKQGSSRDDHDSKQSWRRSLFFIYLNFTICPIGHLVKYYSLENKSIACGWLPPARFHLPDCLLYFYCEICGMLLQSSFYNGFIRFSNQLIWACYKSFFILFCICGDFLFNCWNF